MKCKNKETGVIVDAYPLSEAINKQLIPDNFVDFMSIAVPLDYWLVVEAELYGESKESLTAGRYSLTGYVSKDEMLKVYELIN